MDIKYTYDILLWYIIVLGHLPLSSLHSADNRSIGLWWAPPLVLLPQLRTVPSRVLALYAGISLALLQSQCTIWYASFKLIWFTMHSILYHIHIYYSITTISYLVVYELNDVVLMIPNRMHIGISYILLDFQLVFVWINTLMSDIMADYHGDYQGADNNNWTSPSTNEGKVCSLDYFTGKIFINDDVGSWTYHVLSCYMTTLIGLTTVILTY